MLKFFLFLCVALIAVAGFKFVITIWNVYRFADAANAVIKIYAHARPCFLVEYNEEKIEIGISKYKLEFTNTRDGIKQIEEIIEEALRYYNKLGALTFVNGNFNADKEEIIKIKNEIDTNKWKKEI